MTLCTIFAFMENLETMSPSIGERRVRTTFNPSDKDNVSHIKQSTAELINFMDQCKGEPGCDSEKGRLLSLAQTCYEEAAMWAVKAVTY